MVADVSAISFFSPILVAVFAFVLMYAILKKTPLLGKSNVINIIVSAIIALIFASVSSAREYIKTIAPWFVILIVGLFFILFLLAFIKKDLFGSLKWLGIVFIVLIVIVMVLSAVKVFNLEPYLPGASEGGGDNLLLGYKHWILEDQVLGGILLIIIGVLVAWYVIKGG